MKVINFIKSKAIYILGAIVLSFFLFNSYHSHTTSTIISIPKTIKITTQDKMVMPEVQKKIEIFNVAPELGFKTSTSILIDKNLNVIQITKSKIGYGFRNKFGLFAGASLAGLNYGLCYSPLYFWKISLDALLSPQFLGVGVSYQVLQNTYTGISYNYNWNNIPSPGLFVTVGF